MKNVNFFLRAAITLLCAAIPALSAASHIVNQQRPIAYLGWLMLLAFLLLPKLAKTKSGHRFKFIFSRLVIIICDVCLLIFITAWMSVKVLIEKVTGEDKAFIIGSIGTLTIVFIIGIAFGPIKGIFNSLLKKNENAPAII